MSVAWELIPAGAEDLEAMVGVFRAEDLAVRGRSELNVAVSRERMAADEGFDALLDQVIATYEGAVIGAAIITSRSVNLAVHPDHDRPGLRADLLRWSELRQTEKGRARFAVGVPAANAATVGLLRDSGYQLERFYCEMARDFPATGAPRSPVWPEGYRVRPIDPGADRVALHRVDDRAFRGRPDFVAETLEEWDAKHLSSSQFSPSWSRLVETVTGEVAGSLIAFTRVDRPRGYVAVLAVDPGHRRHGLGRTLLLESFLAMHTDGLSGVELHVASDNDGALDLYRGVGMSAGERFEDYAKTV